MNLSERKNYKRRADDGRKYTKPLASKVKAKRRAKNKAARKTRQLQRRQNEQ